MTSKSKIKGNNFERELVNKLKASGRDAKRAYASNGESLGLTEDVDVVLYEEVEDLISGRTIVQEELKIQCKRRKKLPKVFGMTPTVDAVVFKMDKEEAYIMLRLDDFIEKYL